MPTLPLVSGTFFTSQSMVSQASVVSSVVEAFSGPRGGRHELCRDIVAGEVLRVGEGGKAEREKECGGATVHGTSCCPGRAKGNGA